MKNTKTKKLVALLLTMVLACSLLAGCGVVQNQPATPSTSTSTDSTPETAAPAQATGTSSVPIPNSTQDNAHLDGAKIILKVAYPDTDTNILNTWHVFARTLKNSLEVYSGGEISCDLYPNDQLGDLTSCLEQCSQGTLDVALSAATGNLASWVPDISAFDIAYLVDDYDTINLVLQGKMLDLINEQLEPAANMKLAAAMCTGFRNLDTYNKPVRTVADMKGLKFRLQSIDAHVAIAEAWGAVPTTVAFSELYSAASTGLMDASENCNYTLFMKNLEEVTKYITDTQHLANICGCMISTKTLDKLTDAQKEILDKSVADARRATIGAVQTMNLSYNQRLADAGVEMISLTDAERQEFKDACFDYCCQKVLPTIDPEFYATYQEEYAAAKAILGK